MFEGALEQGTTARIRERVLEQGAAERRIGHGTRNASVEPNDDVNQWVAFLPNKGTVFRTLINNARALETVRFILGEHAVALGPSPGYGSAGTSNSASCHAA